MSTGFFWDERCFWHGGGNYAFLAPVGGLVEPMPGGLPESPAAKRRLRSLIDVTGLAATLDMRGADPATWEDLARVHPEPFLEKFKMLSDDQGGELGLRTPFSKGGFEIAALSAGLSVSAVSAVLSGEMRNAYALSRPPGHHCLPEWPNGFCLLANIAIAIEASLAKGLARRIAVIDWDVHHGNGTEAIFYDRSDVLTISLHQERNYPLDTGDAEDRGRGAGEGFNCNIPLPPGTGEAGYLSAWDRIVVPQVDAFAPDLIIVACGFDASGVDPLGRMLLGAQSFAKLTARASELADRHCGGRLVLVHEGGYSELHVPFCGHAAIATLAGSGIDAGDPLGPRIAGQQPGPEFDGFVEARIDAITRTLGIG
ncbi:class II histone deacetylase [Palleronia sp. LCG004]|uniref:class II histone deacetylase n=1 Tax=Palleronia sp. LCG004 TaxID=3079304 RepID=UPI002942D394|nr:class II histone deacetylase [Palleronia sp. LCG004]WOI55651.1 class II histone deacetylase [Palleronia sp. LCG004]